MSPESHHGAPDSTPGDYAMTTAPDLYEIGYLTREAERAGVSLVEYLISGLRAARDSAASNADLWRARTALEAAEVPGD